MEYDRDIQYYYVYNNHIYWPRVNVYIDVENPWEIPRTIAYIHCGFSTSMQ